jgi:hypothetical protein
MDCEIDAEMHLLLHNGETPYTWARRCCLTLKPVARSMSRDEVAGGSATRGRRDDS